MNKPITIAGGGLAGLTLGINLRRQNVPVTIIEAGRYPRHRVCGEFISGRGREALVKLGLEEKFFAAGAREAVSAAFFSERVTGEAQTLPEPALCLTRYAMDALLAREFERLGGGLRVNERWRGAWGEGVVRATGRQIRTESGGWRWFALKVHAENAAPQADLEVHFATGGYVGICRLNEGVSNICGLFRTRSPVPGLAQTWRRWLQDTAGPVLRERLAKARFIKDSFSSAAGLAPHARFAAGPAEIRIGDAITMIAPFTGNGMSMSFESAMIAADSLAAYSAGEISWLQARRKIDRDCQSRFRPRLRWSALLQSALFRQRVRDGMIRIGSRRAVIWRALFARTR